MAPTGAVAQPFKRSAIEVLSGTDGLLTAGEIVEKAVDRRLLDRSKASQALEQTMGAVLSNNVSQRGAESEFVKRGDRFGLKRGRPDAGERARDAVGGARAAPDAGRLQVLYNGRAGEYAVVSELLFEGFDACAANVDEGTDVFAVKGGRCFFIQVKTSVPERDTCSFFIPPGTHKKFNIPDAYYAFVARSAARNDFLVMPYHEIQKHIESGNIKKMSRKYRATFVWRDKVTLAGSDVTYYRRKWPRA